jgi:hypothetical protein
MAHREWNVVEGKTRWRGIDEVPYVAVSYGKGMNWFTALTVYMPPGDMPHLSFSPSLDLKGVETATQHYRSWLDLRRLARQPRSRRHEGTRAGAASREDTVDPDMTLARMVRALRVGDTGEAHNAARDLKRWLCRGGFAPVGLRALSESRMAQINYVNSVLATVNGLERITQEGKVQ